MLTPKIQVTLGDETFTLSGLKVQEMAKVKSWTSLKNREEWWKAITEEDPDALIAAYVLVKQRKGEQVRFSDADFDLDTFDVDLVDEQGRKVMPVFEQNTDGTVKTRDDGSPIPALKDGEAQWKYVETGEPVPPTELALVSTI